VAWISIKFTCIVLNIEMMVHFRIWLKKLMSYIIGCLRKFKFYL